MISKVLGTSASQDHQIKEWKDSDKTGYDERKSELNVGKVMACGSIPSN